MLETISSFMPILLTSVLEVEALITVHYFEYPKDFIFKGEAHDFWEFLYVDKGEVSIHSCGIGKILKQGEIIFHKPNEFHSVECNGIIAPNLVVISFVCNDSSMNFFNNKILSVSNRAKNMLGTIIEESKICFKNDISDPYFKELILSDNNNSLSLIKSSLETFLIYLLMQRYEKKINLNSNIHIKEIKSRVEKTISYLEKNINQNLTLDQICNHTMIGKSLMQKIFKEETGWSVMEYYYRIKINRAKLLIQKGDTNFSGIAEALG
ncbi:MAG: hypothetical protein JJE21_07620, partial [Spirochaetaceae bacterium]|nr:hypothetical protein [Spirochaetaceae bacterium]